MLGILSMISDSKQTNNMGNFLYRWRKIIAPVCGGLVILVVMLKISHIEKRMLLFEKHKQEALKEMNEKIETSQEITNHLFRDFEQQFNAAMGKDAIHFKMLKDDGDPRNADLQKHMNAIKEQRHSYEIEYMKEYEELKKYLE